MLILKIIFTFILLLPITTAQAHRGGQIKSGPLVGCHNDRKNGGFHCHTKSPLNGKSFASKEHALQYIQGPSSATPLKDSTKKESAYKRSLYKHWIDSDGDCQNQRHEILIQRSLTAVKLSKNGCRVLRGKWDDWYYPEVLTVSSDIDIDHVIPLAHAHAYGASNWNSKKRELFANDPENLIITNKTYNRSKGAKSIADWLPINKNYACRYIKKWFYIKKKYGLKVGPSEIETAKTANCK